MTLTERAQLITDLRDHLGAIENALDEYEHTIEVASAQAVTDLADIEHEIEETINELQIRVQDFTQEAVRTQLREI